MSDDLEIVLDDPVSDPLDLAVDEPAPEPDASPPEPAAPDDGPLLALVARLDEHLAADAERAAHRESVIDRLHAENQTLRSGELERALEPILRGVLRVYDEIGRSTARLVGLAPIDATAVSVELDGLAQEVEMVLQTHGFERIDVAVGEPFVARLHRAVSSVETGDAEADATVERVVRIGFQSVDRILRPSEVVVRRYVTDVTSPTQPTQPTTEQPTPGAASS